MRKIAYLITYYLKSNFCKESIGEYIPILRDSIGLYSTMWGISELIYNTSSYDSIKKIFTNHYILILVLCFIFVFWGNREDKQYSTIVKHKDIKIGFKVKRLENITADSYVIPTNTSFRTNMDREFISVQSVQGAIQNKVFHNNLCELNQMLQKSLDEQNVTYVKTRDILGEARKYPVGTVAKVDYKHKHYYFVAINDINEFGKPVNQTQDNIDQALESLKDTILTVGHYDRLCVPLLGTGKAAISGVTKNDIFRKTIDLFKDEDKKISSELIVAINPKDYFENRIDLKACKKYIDYRSIF